MLYVFCWIFGKTRSMEGNQLKALIITILLFGSVAYYFVGSPGLPDLSSWKSKFKKEKTVTKTKKRPPRDARQGQVIDNYKGVNVYYNGHPGSVAGRHTTKDGYNLGLKYQCVEFAKRFFYERHNHKMPDSYGHAREFFDQNLPDGTYNSARGMKQFRNGSNVRPQPDDLVIIGGTTHNSFGHLLIITNVDSDGVDFVQQNPGPKNPSRGKYRLKNVKGKWYIDQEAILGWLRMP